MTGVTGCELRHSQLTVRAVPCCPVRPSTAELQGPGSHGTRCPKWRALSSAQSGTPVLQVSDQGNTRTRSEAVQHADFSVSPRGRVPKGWLSTRPVEQFALDADSIVAVAKADSTQSTDGFGEGGMRRMYPDSSCVLCPKRRNWGWASAPPVHISRVPRNGCATCSHLTKENRHEPARR